MFSKSASKNCISSVSRKARPESGGDLDRKNKLLGQDKDLSNRMGMDSNYLGVGHLPSMSHLPSCHICV